MRSLNGGIGIAVFPSPRLRHHALRRNPNPYPNFSRVSCMEGTNYVVVGKDVYFLSGDGFLMPTKQHQAPPDLRYFKQPQR